MRVELLRLILSNIPCGFSVVLRLRLRNFNYNEDQIVVVFDIYTDLVYIVLFCSTAFASKKAAGSSTVGEPCGTDVELSLPTVSETEPSNPGGSNASTMSNVSSYNEHESNGSSVCSGGEEHSLKEYEIVRNILYATRENINIVHEVYRQVSDLVMKVINFH